MCKPWRDSATEEEAVSVSGALGSGDRASRGDSN